MKRALKIFARIISSIATFPLVIAYTTTRKESVFITFAQLLSFIPSTIGSYLRSAYYKRTLSSYGDMIHIDFGSYFSHPEASVGDHVYIGAYTIIGMSKIGRLTTIGSQVSILSGKNQHHIELGMPIQNIKGQFTETIIGENCWLGNHSIVMADLGQQCIVGAGAVITKPFGDYDVIAGNPARTIRNLQST
ncbi:acyltransferase [Oceanidesulfovibrio marinus]|uniref:Acyltransferase n=1 Tax=Oceanidesulfovibrio marinus TaxID=370038 RepID=A0A6P1ZH45_9BACT|nr:acyltransferase [Oceanidesulfovibrio marinus]QJT07957.1 acyltransferase [Oceanidesulfovibrio marinus]TVM33455.1 acyltransferase [Oceanidesulfovibrio marinus]